MFPAAMAQPGSATESSPVSEATDAGRVFPAGIFLCRHFPFHRSTGMYTPSMEEILVAGGYPALFLFSFLAATIIPLGSEWLLTAMIIHGEPVVPVVATATTGNFLGACTTYLIGLYGGPFLIKKVLRVEEKSRQRAELFFARYGSWSLLLSWVPVIGDPLCLVAGIFRIPWISFSLLVITGKLARYATLAVVVRAALGSA